MGFLTFFLAAAATSIAISYIKSRIDPLNDVQDLKHWPAPQKVVIQAPQIVPRSLPLPCPNAPQTRPACPKCQFCGKEDHVLKVGDYLPLYEDSFHEFKSGGSDSSDSWFEQHFIRYACAFLNRSGGMLWFGIEDDGEISGFNCDSSRFDLLRLRFARIAAQFNPVLSSDMYQVKLIALAPQGTSSGLSPLSLICIVFNPPTSSHIVYRPMGCNVVSVRALASVRVLSEVSIWNRCLYGLPSLGPAFRPTVCPIASSVTSRNFILGEILPRDMKTNKEDMKVAANGTQLLELFARSTKSWNNGPKVVIWLGIDDRSCMLGWEDNRKNFDELLKRVDNIAHKVFLDPAFYHMEVYKLSTLIGTRKVYAGKILLRLSLLPKPHQLPALELALKVASSPPPVTSVPTKKKEMIKKDANAPAIPKPPPRLGAQKPQKKATSAPKKAMANEKKQNRAQKPKTGKAPVAKAKAKVGAASA